MVILEALSAARRIMIFEPNEGTFCVEARKIKRELAYFGLVGTLHLGFAKYIVVVTKRELAACNKDKAISIWRVLNVAIVPVWRQQLLLTLDQESYEKQVLKGVKDHMSSGCIYYSFEMNLTKSLSVAWTPSMVDYFINGLNTPKDTFRSHCIDFKDLDASFTWNHSMLEPILNPDTTPFLLPVICGHVVSQSLKLDGPEVQFIQICRLNRINAGSRYWVRGVNEKGVAAIEAQHEIVLIRQGYGLTSHTLARGSIPLFWTQHNIISPFIAPKIESKACDSLKSIEACKTHLLSLTNLGLGSTVECLDTIQSNASHTPLDEEAVKLSSMFEKVVKEWKFKQVKYTSLYGIVTPLDLTKTLKPLVQHYGHFFIQKNGPDPKAPYYSQYVSKQSGLLRVNGLDSLEETMQVHYIVSMLAYEEMLKTLGVWSRDRTGWDLRSEYLIHFLMMDVYNGLCWYSTGTPALPLFPFPKHLPFRSLFRFDSFHTLWITVARVYMSHVRDYVRQETLDLIMDIKDRPETTLGWLVPAASKKSNSRRPSVVPPSHNPQIASVREKMLGGTMTPPVLTRSPSASLPTLEKHEKPVLAKTMKDVTNTKWYIAFFLILSKQSAPDHVQSIIEWLFATLWLLIYGLLVHLFKADPKLFFRTPKSRPFTTMS